MSRRQRGWILAIFLIMLVISLIINVPVKQIFRFVELPPHIGIQGVQGSIVKGKVASISYQNFRLKDISYSFQPFCLFKLAVCYDLSSTQAALKLNIETSIISQAISVSESQIQLGPEIIKTIPGLLVKPKGEFLLEIEDMTFVDFKLADIRSKIDWMDAGIQGEEQVLGNYTALISREKERIKIKLADNDSLLSVNGDIQVRLDGQYDLDIKLVSRPALDKSVISVLEMTAKKTGLNRFSIKKAGRVPPDIMKILQQIQPTI